MDSGLQKKLTSFEETPPPGVWDKIADALDEEENFASRLYNYTAQPPLTAWNNIEKGLDEEKSVVKIIPFATRFNKIIRVAAAAAILAIIATTAFLVLQRSEDGVAKVGNTPTIPSTQTITQGSKQSKIGPDPVASAAVVSIKETPTKQAKFRRRLLNIIQPQALLTSIAVAGKFIPENVIKEAMFDDESLDNYMVFTDGAGMTMRMPKKLFPLVSCKDGDRSCRQRIKSLQKKISSASVSTDFGAVLEMLHQVQ